MDARSIVRRSVSRRPLTFSDVDYANIQGLVRFGYGHLDEARFYLLQIRDPQAARSWLTARLPPAPAEGEELGRSELLAQNAQRRHRNITVAASPISLAFLSASSVSLSATLGLPSNHRAVSEINDLINCRNQRIHNL